LKNKEFMNLIAFFSRLFKMNFYVGNLQHCATFFFLPLKLMFK
jgi:hypothetical protein